MIDSEDSPLAGECVLNEHTEDSPLAGECVLNEHTEDSLVLTPCPAFCRLWYGNSRAGEPGNEATLKT